MAGSPQKRQRRSEARKAIDAAGGKVPDGVAEEFRAFARRDGEQSWKEWQASRDVNAQRRDAIVRMMSEGRWLPGVSQEQLAEAWGVSPEVVHHRAQEAGRVLRALCTLTDEFKEEVLAEVLTTFRVIRTMAMQKATEKGNTNPAGSLGVALQATRLFGFYTGVEPAKKTEDVTPKQDPFEGWTPEEVRDFADTGRKPRRALVALSTGNFGLIGEKPIDTQGEPAATPGAGRAGKLH